MAIAFPSVRPWGPALLAGAVFAGVGLGAYLTVAGRRGARTLLNPPPRQPREAPEDYGLVAEEVRLPGQAGALAAWWIPAAVPTDRAIALFHGHSAARSQLLKYASFLQPEFNCLLVDFRACGDSVGPCSTMGMLEAQDVHTAVDWLSGRGQTRIGAFGMSMGGAAALRAAIAEDAIRCLVTDGTFDRVGHVIEKRARDLGYPFPSLVASATLAEVRRRIDVRIGGADPVDLIGRLAPRPVLIIHGTDDATSEVVNGERLFAAAGPDRTLWLVPGAGHTEAWRIATAEYERRVLNFFRAHLSS